MPFVRVWIHLIWSTKNREPMITRELRSQLLSHVRDNATKQVIWLDSLGAVSDHVHTLVSLGTDQSIARIAQLLKGESSHWINHEKLTPFKFEWQQEYLAVSVSDSMLNVVREYIKNQEEHHRKKSSLRSTSSSCESMGFKFFKKEIETRIATTFRSWTDEGNNLDGFQPHIRLGYPGSCSLVFFDHELSSWQLGIEQVMMTAYRISEQETRYSLIDPQLKRAGWNLSDRTQIGLEIPVSGYDAHWGEGITDYCLYRSNGDVLAVVEAKRTSREPRVGRQQVLEYVTTIEKKQSFRPFAFMANGEDIFLWDSANSAERHVAGFFSSENLERLLLLKQNRKPLNSIQIKESIVNRAYQIEAIRRSSEAIGGQKPTMNTVNVRQTAERLS